MSIQDPIAATVYEVISLWLQNKIPNGPAAWRLEPEGIGLVHGDR